jgi:hypothetical protein
MMNMMNMMNVMNTMVATKCENLYLGLGAHPASYQMGTRGSFPGGKAAGV